MRLGESDTEPEGALSEEAPVVVAPRGSVPASAVTAQHLGSERAGSRKPMPAAARRDAAPVFPVDPTPLAGVAAQASPTGPSIGRPLPANSVAVPAPAAPAALLIPRVSKAFQAAQVCARCETPASPNALPALSQAVTGVGFAVQHLIDTVGRWFAALPVNPFTDFLSGGLWLVRQRLFPVGGDVGLWGTADCVKTKDCSGQDLTGAELARLDLSGVNFTEATLNRADLEGSNLASATLERAALNGARLTATLLVSADFSGASLNGALLDKSRLGGAQVLTNFSDADLRGALLPTDRGTVSLAGASLTGANLAGLHLAGIDLRGKDLRGVNFTGANLNGATLAGADLSGAGLADADLSRVKLTQTDFSGADLRGVRLLGVSDADLVSATWTDANLSGLNFSRRNLTGINWAGVKLTDAVLHDTTLTGATLSRTNFSRADLSGARLDGVSDADLVSAAWIRADLTGVDLAGRHGLAGINLTGANLTRAKLDRTGLSGAVLTGTDLTNATLTGSNLSRADLAGAILAGVGDADLVSVTWTDANLSGQDFSRRTLAGVNWAGANLTNAALNDTTLSGATLTKTNFSGADLRGAKLAGVSDADLVSATWTGANLAGQNFSTRTLTGINWTNVNLTRAILIGANLSRADLSGAKLAGVSDADLLTITWDGANLAGQNLSGRVLSDIKMPNVILSSANLTGTILRRANLTGAQLTGTDLSDAVLNNADLTRANLAGAKLTGVSDAGLASATWDGANLIGQDLSGRNLSGIKMANAILASVNLTGTTLRQADLSGADLRRAQLGNATLAGAKLANANFRGADLRGTILTGVSDAELASADLTGAKLAGQNLSGRKLSGIRLANADLQRVNLSGADLSTADLSGATLREANLTGAELRDANLYGADLVLATLDGVTNFATATLTGANLSGQPLIRLNLAGKDLTGTNFSGAILSGTNLSGSDLYQANLRDAKLVGVNLSGASLAGTDLFSANLRNANLDSATGLRSAKNFETAILIGADFANTDLTAINFNGNLSGASFEAAVLKYAEFSQADLTNVSFYRADLTETQFIQVAWRNTTCPDGSKTDSGCSSSGTAAAADVVLAGSLVGSDPGIATNPAFSYQDATLAGRFAELAYKWRDSADFSERVEATGWQGIRVSESAMGPGGFSPAAGGYGVGRSIFAVQDGMPVQSFAFAGRRTISDGTEQFVFAVEGSNACGVSCLLSWPGAIFAGQDRADWNANAQQYGWSRYYASLQPLMAEVLRQMIALQESGTKTQLIITGHSLGGATAMVAYADLLAPQGNLYPGPTDVLATGKRIWDQIGDWTPATRQAIQDATTVYTFGAPSPLIDPVKDSGGLDALVVDIVSIDLVEVWGKILTSSAVRDDTLPEPYRGGTVNRVFQFEHSGETFYKTSFDPGTGAEIRYKVVYADDFVSTIGSRDPGYLFKIRLRPDVHEGYVGGEWEASGGVTGVSAATHEIGLYNESLVRLATWSPLLADSSPFESVVGPPTSSGQGSDQRNDVFLGLSDAGRSGNDWFAFARPGTYTPNGGPGNDLYELYRDGVALSIDGQGQSGADGVIFVGPPREPFGQIKVRTEVQRYPQAVNVVYSVTGGSGTSTLTVRNWDEWAPSDVFTVNSSDRWILERVPDAQVGPVS